MGALVSPTHLTRLSCGLREVTDAEGLRELEERGRITTGGITQLPVLKQREVSF